MSDYTAAIVDGIARDVAARYRDRDDISVADITACDWRLIHAYRSGERVRVVNRHGTIRTGRVSRTTGWRPALLLMARSNQRSSSDVLGPDDRVIAVQRSGREYVPVTSSVVR